MTEGIPSQVERTPSMKFKEDLDRILYTPLSVENIGRFADDALNELIELNESVVHRYQREYPESDILSGAALEDAAYTAYELENLGAVLDRITAVRDRIAAIAQRVQESLSQTDSVIVPPDDTGPAFGNIGSGTYEAPDKLNRLITLAYILETDFDLDQDNVRYRQGITTDTMVRQEPYVRVEIDDLNRVVYVCDEEGNASYVFDAGIIADLGISLEQLDLMTKNERNALIRVQSKTGRRIVQSPAWRIVVSQALREPFTSDGKVPVPTEVVPRSEFAEQGQFLEFSDFVTEVKAAYEASGEQEGVQAWYLKEYHKHTGWPSNPNRSYKNKGWKSFPDLVGREKVEFLNFSDFKTAVRKKYTEAGSPSNGFEWYQKTYDSNPGWHSAPNSYYKDKGWKSFPDLVGDETVEFLELKDLKTAVRKKYTEAGSPGDKKKWYYNEYKKNAGWPPSPQDTYKNKGWKSFPDFVGDETVDFLEFKDFMTKVRSEFMAAGSPNDIDKWYREEYKKQTGWPSSPDQTYKKTGWQSYRALVGREIVTFPVFASFQSTVKAAYMAAGSPGNVRDWYRSEYKRQPNWPSNPALTYKESGWKSHNSLVGKI